MNDADKVFREDPWEGIDDSNASRRLYEKDKRFWVSVDEDKRLVFFIRETGKYEIKNLPSSESLPISTTDEVVQIIQLYQDGSFRTFSPKS